MSHLGIRPSIGRSGIRVSLRSDVKPSAYPGPAGGGASESCCRRLDRSRHAQRRERRAAVAKELAASAGQPSSAIRGTLPAASETWRRWAGGADLRRADHGVLRSCGDAWPRREGPGAACPIARSRTSIRWRQASAADPRRGARAECPGAVQPGGVRGRRSRARPGALPAAQGGQEARHHADRVCERGTGAAAEAPHRPGHAPPDRHRRLYGAPRSASGTRYALRARGYPPSGSRRTVNPPAALSGFRPRRRRVRRVRARSPAALEAALAIQRAMRGGRRGPRAATSGCGSGLHRGRPR